MDYRKSDRVRRRRPASLPKRDTPMVISDRKMDQGTFDEHPNSGFPYPRLHASNPFPYVFPPKFRLASSAHQIGLRQVDHFVATST